VKISSISKVAKSALFTNGFRHEVAARLHTKVGGWLERVSARCVSVNDHLPELEGRERDWASF
jgi:hypothetical protein